MSIKQRRSCWIDKSKFVVAFFFYITLAVVSSDTCNEASKQRQAQLTVLFLIYRAREKKQSVKHKNEMQMRGLTFRKPKEILREKLGRFYK